MDTSKTQPTIDGKPLPLLKEKEKKPLPPGYKVAGKTRIYTATKKKPAPKKKRKLALTEKEEAIANGTYRFTELDDITPQHKLRKLLDWHEHSPGSYYDWDYDAQLEADWPGTFYDEAKDKGRILTEPRKTQPRHYEE